MILLLLLIACGGGTPPAEEAHHEEAEPAHDEVVLSATALANARLRVEPLGLAALEAATIVPARITLDPSQEAQVAAVTAGRLERILVRPGDRVETGDALGTVLSPDLGEAIGAHLSATARLEVAHAKVERTRSLEAGGFSSAAQLAEAEADLTVAAADAEAAEERLRVFGVSPERFRPKEGQHFSSRFQVRSPIDGEILGIDAAIGASVASGDALFHVGNLDRVWLILDVYERQLAAVQPGANVSFTVEAWGDEAFQGTVDVVGGWIDPDSRTAEVRVLVANPDHRLKPNMFAQARLALAGATTGEGLMVPADAVQEVDGRSAVFVEQTPGTFRVRPVTTERLPDGRLQLTGGVQAGERVVLEGAFTLKSELAKGELGEGHAH